MPKRRRKDGEGAGESGGRARARERRPVGVVESSAWRRPRRWFELLLLAWALSVGVHYYRTTGFVDLLMNLLGFGR